MFFCIFAFIVYIACIECPGNRDPETNCTTCKNHWTNLIKNCNECPTNWNPSSDCSRCKNHWIDRKNNCGTCLGNWDPKKDCGVCLNKWEGPDCDICPPNVEQNFNCSVCLNHYSGPECNLCSSPYRIQDDCAEPHYHKFNVHTERALVTFIVIAIMFTCCSLCSIPCIIILICLNPKILVKFIPQSKGEPVTNIKEKFSELEDKMEIIGDEIIEFEEKMKEEKMDYGTEGNPEEDGEFFTDIDTPLIINFGKIN